MGARRPQRSRSAETLGARCLQFRLSCIQNELAKAVRTCQDSRVAVFRRGSRSHEARSHHVEVHHIRGSAGGGAGARRGRPGRARRGHLSKRFRRGRRSKIAAGRQAHGGTARRDFRCEPHDRAQRPAGARARPYRHDRTASRSLRLGAYGRRRAGHLLQPQDRGIGGRARSRAADRCGGHRQITRPPRRGARGLAARRAPEGDPAFRRFSRRRRRDLRRRRADPISARPHFALLVGDRALRTRSRLGLRP